MGMQSSLIKEFTSNKFLIILVDEKEYARNLDDIIRTIQQNKTRICYVCLSKPYTDVLKDLESMGMKRENFFFIDIMTSHYTKPIPQDDCIFLSSASNLDDIRQAVRKAVEEKNCSTILFDTISTLLIYQEKHSIVEFTHNLISEKEQENTKKLFIVLKEGNKEEDTLTDDLQMFADKKIDLRRKNINPSGA